MEATNNRKESTMTNQDDFTFAVGMLRDQLNIWNRLVIGLDIIGVKNKGYLKNR